MKIFFMTLLLLISNLNMDNRKSKIDNLINNGEFAKAKIEINKLLKEKEISPKEKLELVFQLEKMKRIALDFSKTKDNILNYIKKYYPDVTETDLKKWEKDGSLEYKIINGKKFYFNRAASNLFRINKEAKLLKEKVDGKSKNNLKLFLQNYLPDVIKNTQQERKRYVKPVRIRLNYRLVVNANAVPEGEIIRCWLPFPRTKGKRQKDVKLIAVNNKHYIISPDEYAHKTIYSEQIAIQGKPTEFKLSVEFTGVNEWHRLTATEISPYDKTSELYRKYTSERLPHIKFTTRVEKISKKIVGNEKNPLLIAKKIYKWINDNIPWAGAREYSTIDNISDYCLKNMHGDCGIKTLTFITLARFNGIPARWESGLMLHPQNNNLHDWGEVYFENIGWVPVDQSFGLQNSGNENVKWFFLGGNDAYHMIVNNNYSQPLYPAKIFPRSETVDFQRGEVEWRGGNLYFDKWDYFIDTEYPEKK